MQFKIRFYLPSPLKLPVNYNSIIQGLIYNILGDNPDYSDFLHNEGYGAEGKSYKLFVFSQLSGKYTYSQKAITFRDEVTLEVRSPIDEFCDIFYYALIHREHFEINRQIVYLMDCTVSHRGIAQERIHIIMQSPLCLTRNSVYLAPTDPDFNELLQENFERKLSGSYHMYPQGRITLTPDHLQSDGSMQPRDKCVTYFKGITIVAWKGRYTLKGDPMDLSFLYDAGLGSRGSQGFGMFRAL